MHMLTIRPINENDLEGLINLLDKSGHGLTSLPRDPEILKRKIIQSQRSFEWREEDRPSGELYLFVMEDVFTGEVIGVSGIISKIGGFDPCYFYRLEEEIRKSKMPKVENIVRSLHLEATHNGPAEICSLYLSPKYRNGQNGRFLSLSRFLFMANNRNHFENEVIAEMRGMVDDDGHSPFWEAVGNKFFHMDFPEADYLQLKTKKFIEELLPKHPLIINLLPTAAQNVVAEVHPETRPARKILEQEGFKFSGLVGVFEPGPVLEAKIDDIRTIVKSKVASVSKILNEKEEGEPYIVANTTENFKTTLGRVHQFQNETVGISAVTATTLNIRLGDMIRYVTLKN